MLWVLGRKLLISLLKHYGWRQVTQVLFHTNSQNLEGRGRFCLFVISVREELWCLISHLRVLGVEAGLSGYGHGFCSVGKNPCAAFRNSYKHLKKRLYEDGKDTAVNH